MDKDKIRYIKQLFEDIDKLDTEVCENLEKAENWVVLPEDEKPLEHGLSITESINCLNYKLDKVVELLKNVVIDIE